MKRTIILTALMAFFAIELFAGTPKPKASQEKWSLKMADMVMTRWDTLGYYGGRTRAGWSYDVSMVGMAIDQLGHIDPKYSAYMKTYMDMLVDQDGKVARYSTQEYNIDYIKPARNLMILYKKTGEEKYKKAIPQFAQQMETHPKTESGGFWHKKRYPNQVWLDGVYMGMPFLTMYAVEFNEPKWFDVVTHEIKLVYEKTRDPKTGLLYHAWDESKKERWSDPKTGLSPHFWSRAMGWYVMAIVDVLDYLPVNHPDVPELKNILKNTLDALLKVRDKKTGCWYQVLDQGGREGNYLEGSGTAMFIYAMAKGSKKGYLDKKYYKIADKAFDQMVKEFIVTGKDGLPDMVRVCGSCGLGGTPYRDGSYQYYITEKIVLNDTKGVGPFILAAIELDK